MPQHLPGQSSHKVKKRVKSPTTMKRKKQSKRPSGHLLSGTVRN